MTRRPVDWSPLADSDPIGGNVEAVTTEAAYYRNLAKEISAQSAKLRKIASDGDQVGKVADKLRDVAEDTAGKLDQTHGRVAAVGEALTSWIPHLETAQNDTLAALNDAKDAVSRQQANAAPPAGSPPPKTDADKTADKARASRLTTADSDLNAARTKFEGAVSERDTQASKAAGHIKDALHDGLKDSWWDSFCNWVAEHVDVIKMIVEILSWVATAIAIIALFIPGLNILALILMVGVLAGHTLLAATGNGSWMDVALDIVGILTFKMGSVLGKMGEEARAATLVRASDLAAEAKTVEVVESRAAQKLLYQSATKGFGKFASPSNFMKWLSVRSGAYDVLTSAKAGWESAGARIAMLERDLPNVNNIDSLVKGGKDIAQNMKDLKALSAVFGKDPEFAANAAQWAKAISGQRATVLFGQGVDLTNHAISTSAIPGLDKVLVGVPAWEDFKESLSHEIPLDPVIHRIDQITRSVENIHITLPTIPSVGVR